MFLIILQFDYKRFFFFNIPTDLRVLWNNPNAFLQEPDLPDIVWIHYNSLVNC